MPRQRADIQIAPFAVRQDFTYQPPDLPEDLPGLVGVRVEFDEADMIAAVDRWVEVSVWSSLDGETWHKHASGRRNGGPRDPHDLPRPYLRLELGKITFADHALRDRIVELRVTASDAFQYSVHAYWDYTV
jgi:hypothetical protein